MAIIIVGVILIRYLFISPFAVEGSSMEPTLHSNELIIVNKIGYANWFGLKFGEPERGDIVVVHPPNDPKKYYIDSTKSIYKSITKETIEESVFLKLLNLNLIIISYILTLGKNKIDIPQIMEAYAEEKAKLKVDKLYSLIPALTKS